MCVPAVSTRLSSPLARQWRATPPIYIYRRLRETGVRVTQLARGVSVGNEIEYTDEVTLGRSLLDRVDYK